jgi:hypothetical protein
VTLRVPLTYDYTAVGRILRDFDSRITSNGTFLQSGTGAVARTVQSKLRDVISPKDFGVVADGVTDDSANVQKWLDYAASVGGVHVWPSGQCKFASQVTLAPTGLVNLVIIAYGAEILTTGAISGFKIQGSAAPHIPAIFGLKVNGRGNATQTNGFEIVNTANLALRDCAVEAHGVAATYAGFLLRNATASDSNTGAFWTTLENCTVRKRSGSDVGDIPCGIRVRGAANATRILGGAVNCGATGYGVEFTPEAGQTYVGNGCFIGAGYNFEGGTAAIHLTNGAGGILPGGLGIGYCRCESTTTFILADGATAETVEPPTLLERPYCTPDVTKIIDNQTAGPLTILNMAAINSGTASSGTVTRRRKIVNYEGTYYKTVDPTYDAATYDLINTGQGIGFLLNGAAIGWLRYAASGFLELAGNVADSVGWCFRQVRGISNTTTRAINLRGTATFAASTSVAVSFVWGNEADGVYTIQLTPRADPVGRLYWDTPLTTGFTIRNTSSTSIAVDWLLIR